MKKYYYWSLLVNTIPVIITYIILNNCSGDGCMGKYLIWLTIPIWAIIYLTYFKIDKISGNVYLKKLIIYSPTLFTSLLGIILTVINDDEMIGFIYAFLLLILPTFIYNIFVEYKLKEIFKNNRINRRPYLHPIFLIILTTMIVTITYKPSYYNKNVFDIGIIEVQPSVNKIQLYLSDSAINKYLLPDSIKVLPYPDYKDWLTINDHYLYFNKGPKEVIHINIVDYTTPYIEIKGIKTLKEEYKWQWKVKVKKNDSEAKRVLNRIEKALKEIDANIKTKIKINEP